ncbi:MAG: patatin-like phospholipase family protein [Gracilibacteraceae bacterium]|jgi:NTE family protein|nr:patatin-like phospholipase family protein [Gracilibacteraceae bacterium]
MPPLALALEGGGARGAYHLGAYKALRELGLEFECVAGTSIGAINGAAIAQGDWEPLYDLWWNITPSQILDIEDDRFSELRQLRFSPENTAYFAQKAWDILTKAGIDTGALRKIIRQFVDEEKLRRSPTGFGLVTFSLSDMKALELFIEDIPAGQLVDYLLASARLPGFRQEKLDGKYFVDGGFYDNLPLRLLESKGYRDIVAIRTKAVGRVRGASRGTRVTTIFSPENTGMVLDFDRDAARNCMRLGYFDAWRAFRPTGGSRYYINLPPDADAWALDFFLQLPEAAVIATGKQLGLPDMPWRRLLLEKLLPRAAALLELKKTADHCALLLAMLEVMASDLGLERFRFYTAEEFTAALREAGARGSGPPPVGQGDIPRRPVKGKAARELIYTLFGDFFA